MRKTEHPAYHTTFRKLCHYSSLLSNFEQPLRDDGFDIAAEHQWAGGTLSVLADLVEPPHKQPPDVDKIRAMEQELEPELFRRMGAVLKFLQARVPDHPWLPQQRLYFQLWRECYGEPVRALTDEDLQPVEDPEEPVIAPTIYGIPFEYLEETRLGLGQMQLAHQGLAPLLMFLSGLFYAMGYFERHGSLPTHEYDDGLLEASRNALADAVDFSNEPGAVELVKQNDNTLMPEPQQLLFLAIYHTSMNHTASVYEWIIQQNGAAYMRGFTALLFAMGVRSLHDPYAKNLIFPWLKTSQQVFDWLPPEGRVMLHTFFNKDFSASE